MSLSNNYHNEEDQPLRAFRKQTFALFTKRSNVQILCINGDVEMVMGQGKRCIFTTGNYFPRVWGWGVHGTCLTKHYQGHFLAKVNIKLQNPSKANLGLKQYSGNYHRNKKVAISNIHGDLCPHAIISVPSYQALKMPQKLGLLSQSLTSRLYIFIHFYANIKAHCSGTFS